MRIDFDALQTASAFDLADPIDITPLPGVPGELRVAAVRGAVYLPSALDRGQSVTVADGVLPVESLLDDRTLEFFLSRKRQPQFADRYSGDLEPATLEGTVCVLGNLFSRNFGHWTEELLKVAVLERAGVDCSYVVAELPDFARSSLRLLGISEDRILSLSEPTLLDRALHLTPVRHTNMAQFPGVLEVLREAVAAVTAAGPSPYGSRLWLERADLVTNGGMTLNKEDVHGLLAHHGFQVVDMGSLPLAEQFRAATGATVIGGPHGAQMVHVQFMPRRSHVIECFSPIHVNPSVLGLCRALGLGYHQVVARSHLVWPYAHGRDLVVDVDHLSLVLETLP